MKRLLLSILILTPVFWIHAVEPSSAPVSFNKDIRPILSENCFSCHGQGKNKGELRLDTSAHFIKAGASGEKAVVPNQPDASELVKRILSTEKGKVMPPPSTKKTLTAAQKETLSKWIAQGAPYEKHWSFEPIKAQAPIEKKPNPIDAYLIAKLKKEGLSYAPKADPSTLLRRVSLTLTGLTPSVQEMETFLADKSPDAYEKMIDRYLASPKYGEEMARHWLDIVRYADTHGLHLDNERQMWAYRDWVISAFTKNQPFDRFMVEQVAGDLIPNATLDQLIATGFNRCNVSTGEGGSISEEWVFRNAVDRTSNFMEAFLGLTGGCAVCHDHKFDPITAKDYYSLYAFFHSAADSPLDGNQLLLAPSVKLDLPETKKKIAELEVEVSALRRKMEEEATKLAYEDPALKPIKSEIKVAEDIWFEDEFPKGSKVFASPGLPLELVDAKKGKVFSGTKAIRRSDAGLAQDVCENMPPITIQEGSVLFANVFLQDGRLPKAIMLQYYSTNWLHRAVWGDYNIIPWGAANTTERVNMGPLPSAGKWIRIEVAAEKVGLKPGTIVTGFAVTQFGGIVFWDKIGMTGKKDPATDPAQSFAAWWQQQTGRDQPEATSDVAILIKQGPAKTTDKDQVNKVKAFYLANHCTATKTQMKPSLVKLDELSKKKTALEQSAPGTAIFRELPKPRDSFVMVRGMYNKQGEKVEPNTPAIFPPLKKADPQKRADRLDLANWLVSPEQPLTSRVMVNRFWQQVFGTGIVKSSGDLGTQGELPFHPELLDWLASDFRANGWDVKKLMKLLLTSEAFQQVTSVSPELLRKDPENRLLARGPRIRLDAEQIRDNTLFTSGLLSFDMGGRGTMPYQPPNIWEPVGFTGSNTRNYKQDTGANLYRRSIYVFIKRTAPAPFMSNFDLPNREALCAKRERSNTPLQALQLMNDVQHFEAARKLAERLITEGGNDAGKRIELAYKIILSRLPAPEEKAIVMEGLEKHIARYKADPKASALVVKVGESKIKEGINESELAAYTLLANTILNLDETVNRN